MRPGDDELDQANHVGAGDDENTPEQPSARKAYFPSSMETPAARAAAGR